jgi:hypothetical protein
MRVEWVTLQRRECRDVVTRLQRANDHDLARANEGFSGTMVKILENSSITESGMKTSINLIASLLHFIISSPEGSVIKKI